MYRPTIMMGFLLMLAACGDVGAGCACMEPVEEAFVPDELGNWSGQIRLSQTGFDFIEQNLPSIVASFVQLTCPDGDVPCPGGTECDRGLCMENGAPAPIIGVRIPPSEGDGVRICHGAGRGDCNVYVRINNVDLNPREPSHLDLVLNANINSSGIKLHRPGTLWPPLPTIRCTVHARAQNKRITVPMTFRTDNPLERTEVRFGDIGFSLDNRDIELCGALDWPIIKDIIMAIVRGDVEDMLDEQIGDVLAESLYVGCAGGQACPAESQCVNDFCQWGGGQRVPIALGVEGLLDLAGMLPGMESKGEPLEMALVVGGAGSTSAHNGGITLGMMGGSRTDGAACVPSDPLPPPADLTPLNWVNNIPGSEETFQVGIGIAADYLNHGVTAFHRSGGMCLGIGSSMSEMVSANTFALLMPSMRKLLDGHSSPTQAGFELRLRPRQVPSMEVGLGRYETDEEGNQVLAEPLLHLVANDFALDLQLAVTHRFVRLATIVVDLNIGLALDINQDNEIMILMGEPDSWIDNVRVEDADLLAESEEEIAEVIPTLLELALPSLAEGLDQAIALPELQGFTIEVQQIRGERARPEPGADGFARYDYLGIYAGLGFTAPGVEPMGLSVETTAQLAHVDHGETRDYDATQDGPLHRPVVEVDLWASGAGDGARYEFTWRVDGGLWQVFQPFESGERVRLSSALFSLPGPHRLELRARVAGARRSLDPEAAILEFDVEPSESLAEIDPHGHLGLLPNLQAPHLVQGPLPEPVRTQPETDHPPEGWSCTATGSSLLWLLALAPIARRRRRES
ncbi:MAG: hypothetical protein CMH55_06130 [Myxococcales bacterium]|nr:hypothetical protein [Myxococcales bacterium]